MDAIVGANCVRPADYTPTDSPNRLCEFAVLCRTGDHRSPLHLQPKQIAKPQFAQLHNKGAGFPRAWLRYLVYARDSLRYCSHRKVSLLFFRPKASRKPRQICISLVCMVSDWK